MSASAADPSASRRRIASDARPDNAPAASAPSRSVDLPLDVRMLILEARRLSGVAR